MTEPTQEQVERAFNEAMESLDMPVDATTAYDEWLFMRGFDAGAAFAQAESPEPAGCLCVFEIGGQICGKPNVPDRYPHRCLGFPHDPTMDCHPYTPEPAETGRTELVGALTRETILRMELEHAVMCMDRSCKRCNETAKELKLLPAAEPAETKAGPLGMCDRSRVGGTAPHVKTPTCDNWRPDGEVAPVSPEPPQICDLCGAAHDPELIYDHRFIVAQPVSAGAVPRKDWADKAVHLIMREAQRPSSSSAISEDYMNKLAQIIRKCAAAQSLPAQTVNRENKEMNECAKCGEEYSLRDGMEPTKYCDSCAHERITELEAQTVKQEMLAALKERWIKAVDRLLSYIEAHGWGTIPEPWDSITPLYELMYGRCPTCQNLDRRGDRSKRDHVRIPDFVCSDKWHAESAIARAESEPPASEAAKGKKS